MSSTYESRDAFKFGKLKNGNKTLSRSSKAAQEKTVVACKSKVDMYYNVFFLAEFEYRCFIL